MAVSVESRVPLLDVNLINIACSIPPVLKFSGGKTKHMLLESIKHLLPKEVVNRKDKMGFPTPFNEWLKGDLKDYILDVLNSQKVKEVGFFNLPAIESQLKDTGKFTRDIWGVLNLANWQKVFFGNETFSFQKHSTQVSQ